MSSPYAQDGFRCRLAWGRRGAAAAAARGDVLVVVDVLSFSTAVAVAVARGGRVHPCGPAEDAVALAERVGGQASVGREEVPARGAFSLSPATLEHVAPGARVVLRSPNGALCTRLAGDVPALYVAGLVNAGATARALSEDPRPVTVLACGERWGESHEDGPLRFALEDYLGAGAVLVGLSGTKSPEALAAEAAFLGLRDRLAQVVRECGSGRELVARGYPQDPRLAAQLDRLDAVAVLRDGALQAL